jgi:hypothetical protein
MGDPVMSYASVARTVVNLARTSGENRILSLDLETKVTGSGQFLTGERILGVSVAWKEHTQVRTKTIVLEEESDAAEGKLFSELDTLLLQLRPLVLVGYYITHYDLPLLNIKLRNTRKPYWGIEDTVTRAYVLDLKDPVRFEVAERDNTPPSALSFDKVVEHERFAGLPLMRARGLARCDTKSEKGAKIYQLWMTDRERFRVYSQGDAHDALLIFEELFPRVVIKDLT